MTSKPRVAAVLRLRVLWACGLTDLTAWASRIYVPTGMLMDASWGNRGVLPFRGPEREPGLAGESGVTDGVQGGFLAGCEVAGLRPGRCGPEWLDVLITDDGRGGTPAASGHGLAGMRERAALYGGQLTAGPGEPGGFSVHARLPVAVGAVT